MLPLIELEGMHSSTRITSSVAAWECDSAWTESPVNGGGEHLRGCGS